jgi:hypothetical protein
MIGQIVHSSHRDRFFRRKKVSTTFGYGNDLNRGDVRFIDDRGIGALQRLRRPLERSRLLTVLVIAHPNPVIRRSGASTNMVRT